MVNLEKSDSGWKCTYKGEVLTFDDMSAGRLLFRGEDFVIKIDHKPSNKKSTRQTAREIEFWETLTEDREFFAQILEHGRTLQGFYWHRQQWYEPDNVSFCTTRNFTILNDLIFKYGIQDIEIHWNDGTGNWMIHKGEVLIYDWGFYA